MRTDLKQAAPQTGSPSTMTTLDALPAGTSAIVRGVAGTSDRLRDRMRAMGLCEGRRVAVLRGGGRLIVTTMGTRIGVARELAMTITVEPSGRDADVNPVPDTSSEANP